MRLLHWLPSLFLCSALAAQTDYPGSVLEVGGLDGYETVGLFETTRSQFVVPLTSRSEQVARAVRSARGISLRLFAGQHGIAELDAVGVRAVEHPVGEQVLLVNAQPWIVGLPRLPAAVQAERGDLAFIARHDGTSLVGGKLSVRLPADLPAGAHVFLIGAQRSPWIESWEIVVDRKVLLLPCGAGQALAIEPQGTTVEIDLGGAALDQLFIAPGRALEDRELRPLPGRAVRRAPAERQAWRERQGAGVRWPVIVWSAGSAPPESGFDETVASVDGRVLELAANELLETYFSAPRQAGENMTWSLHVELERADTPVEIATPVAAALRGPQRPSGFLRDVTSEAGLAMVHLEGPDQQMDIRPTMGPGLAWGDVDGDGWVDLYLVQGAGRAASEALPNRLYKNNQDGTFTDITGKSRVGDTGAGMGALFFDADSDGDLDLYVANYGADVCYENVGAGVFRDVSAEVGVGADKWSAGVAAADYDRDGDLDLYITSYLDFDLEKLPGAAELGHYQREDPIPMLPFAFPGAANTFLENGPRPEAETTFAFADKTSELGVADEQGRGMQAVFWDFDSDGDDDLYIANDVSFNVLFRNEDGQGFKDISFSTGLDDPRGGMGLALGDVDGDQDEDLFLTNWQLETNALYLNNSLSPYLSKHRRSNFGDGTVRSGLGPASIGVTSWGATLFDAENDGDLDLFVANGYTSPDYEGTGICVGQPNQFFENNSEGRFAEASSRAGPALGVTLASRAASACDYDQDGRMDMVVTANNGRVQLLHNESTGTGHWILVRLRGANGNTFGIGAIVTVHTPTQRQRRSLRAGTGYLSGNPAELHFGLGASDTIEKINVRWPSGASRDYEIDAVDRVWELAE